MVEAARGFSALYVLFSHLEGALALRKDFPDFRFLIALFSDYAHEAVILFFLLSGFSIHYSSQNRPLNTPSGVLHYYALRLRRIYPIFVVSVALTLMLDVFGSVLGVGGFSGGRNVFDIRYLLEVLTFQTDRSYVSGIIAPVLPGNNPLWSLSYEVVYYALYPAYWLVARRLGAIGGIVWGLAISLVAAFTGILSGPNHPGNVLGLYIIWCLGAYIGELRRRRDPPAQTSMYMLIAVTYVIAQSVWVIEYSGLGIAYEWLWGLLFFMVMLSFIMQPRSWPPSNRQRLALALTILAGVVVIAVVSTRIELSRNPLDFYIKIVVVAAIALLCTATPSPFGPNQLACRLLWRFYPLGAVSYALYVVHYPIIRFAQKMLAQFELNKYFLLATLPVIAAIAYLLECRLQPWINTKFPVRFANLQSTMPASRKRP